MPSLADLEPLDEFDARTAQILLGDNPAFRESVSEQVALLEQLITDSGDQAMITRLAELDAAHEAYRGDTVWVGPAYERLLEAERPLLRFLGVLAE